MQRALSVNLPMWPIDLLRRRDSHRHRDCNFNPSHPSAHPILLFAVHHGVQAVAHGCELAVRAGVKRGMTVMHARALVDGACRVEPFTPERDALALHRLAQWALRYSPLVAPDPPDGLLIDITGCQRAFGGEERLLRIIVNDLNRLGFTVHVACASTFGCAWAMARFGVGVSCVPPGHERNTLASLPIAALRIDQLTIDALHELEITLIGHLFNLPRLQLAARFGRELLLRLDQSLGDAFETVDPVRPQPPPTVERIFDGPTTQLEGIEITVQQLLEELAVDLLHRECGVRRLDLKLRRVGTHPILITITLSRPNRNPRHVWSLLRPHIEQANLGFGVDRITIIAIHTGKLAHQQIRFEKRIENPGTPDLGTPSEDVPVKAGELIDTIASRFGPDRILRAVPIESHIPEAAFEFRSAMHALPQRVLDANIALAERPTLLLARLMQIEVELTNHRPARVFWQDIYRPIITCIGPERIALAWWRSRNIHTIIAPPVRDYFKLQESTGRWLWVCRDSQTNQWFMHGWWA